MSTRVCSPPTSMTPSTTMELPTSGSLPVSSANQATVMPTGPFIYGAGLRNSSEYTLISAAAAASSRHATTTTSRQCAVSRCLFGPPDPKSGQFAREKVKEFLVEGIKKWEFDFVNDKPLEGAKRFRWEKVSTHQSKSSSLENRIPPPAPSKKSTSSASSTVTAISDSRDSLFIARVVSPLPSTSTSAAAACLPPTPVKSSPERLSPERSPGRPGPVTIITNTSHQRHQTSTSYSSSSQSSPEIQEISSFLTAPIISIPSPPSSLEESSSPSSPSAEESCSGSGQRNEECQPLVMSQSKKATLTGYMPQRKRRAASTTITSSSETASPPEKKAAL